LAAHYGEAAGITEHGTAERLESLFDKYGLHCKESADNLYYYIKQDKKITGDTVDLVLLKGIGRSEIFEIPLSEIEEQLAEL